ncbi:MAG TPA: methionyl-tRNA formyltransferase, partial [Chloroflexota bacterium]|nr:methionyl-tRNA formyltransferase [Chloroflexota bacterium]
YAPRLRKEDGRIDWTKPAERLVREVRAYTTWPGSFTYWNGKLLKVLRARRQASGVRRQQDQTGTVLPGLVVVTGDGELALERVQLESRKLMDADEFLRGQPNIVGAHLD